MTVNMGKLTNKIVEEAQPREKPYKLWHGDRTAMYLYVMPSGRKYWRMNYRVGNSARIACLGIYPNVDLAEALKRAATFKKTDQSEMECSLAMHELVMGMSKEDAWEKLTKLCDKVCQMIE